MNNILLLRRGLTGQERAAAIALILESQALEGIELPLPLDASAELLLALNDDQLAGIVAFQHSENVLEITGIVAPEMRHKGLGRAMLHAANAAAQQHNMPMLLVIDEAAVSGRGFVAALGLALDHREYCLELDSTAFSAERAMPAGLQIRSATHSDQATLALIQAQAFDDDHETVQRMVAAGLNNPTREYLLAEQDGQPVALLRIGRYERFADITSFGVLPAQHGQGIGRALLQYAVEILLAEGWAHIGIDVFTDNEAALGLYQSCGFRLQRCYGYYCVPRQL